MMMMVKIGNCRPVALPPVKRDVKAKLIIPQKP